jgi:hypothetical protein
MTSLLNVAEGILDAEEYRDYNLSDIESVQQYASAGLDYVISDNQAELVRDCCLNWLKNGEFGSSYDYYNMIVKKLSDD